MILTVGLHIKCWSVKFEVCMLEKIRKKMEFGKFVVMFAENQFISNTLHNYSLSKKNSRSVNTFGNRKNPLTFWMSQCLAVSLHKCQITV